MSLFWRFYLMLCIFFANDILQACVTAMVVSIFSYNLFSMLCRLFKSKMMCYYTADNGWFRSDGQKRTIYHCTKRINFKSYVVQLTVSLMLRTHRWTVDVLYNGSHWILTINVVSLLLCIGWAVYSLLLTLNNMLLLLRKQIHITDDVTSALFYGKVANWAALSIS